MSERRMMPSYLKAMISSASRAVLLWTCRIFGSIGDLFRKPVLMQAAILVTIAAALAAADRWAAPAIFRRLRDEQPVQQATAARATRPLQAAAASPGPPNRKLTPQALTVTNLLAVWAFALVATSISRARRRLIIARFDDFSDKRAGLEMSGFAVLVSTHLSGLNELFSEFDSAAAIDSDTGSLQAPAPAFEAEGGSVDLERATAGDTSLALGPVKLPVGFVLALLGRIVQGPRLTGQVHYDSGQRIVTLRLAGARSNRSWRIVDAAVSGEPGNEVWRPASDLAHELACRVIGEMSTHGTVRWETLSKFAAGVRAYRRSRRHPRERLASLREAERRLLEASGEDPNFDLALYNLGVVFAEGQQLEPASSAFELAQKRNGQRWSTHYAVAKTSHDRAVAAFNNDARDVGLAYLAKTLSSCERAVARAPSAAARSRVLALTALAHWWHGHRGNQETTFREVNKSARAGRRAVWAAWRALCAAELGIGATTFGLAASRAQTRGLAAAALQQLGGIEVAALVAGGNTVQSSDNRFTQFMRSMILRNGRIHLREAWRLAPDHGQIGLDLGRVYVLSGQWNNAEQILRKTALLMTDVALPRALLALSLANLGRHNEAREAIHRLFERPDLLDPDSTIALTAAGDLQIKLIEDVEALASTRDQQGASGKERRRFALVRFVTAFLHLTYRLADRRFISLSAGTQTLVNLLNDPSARTGRIESIKGILTRAQSLLELRKEIPGLVNRGAEGVEPLAALHQKMREANQPWEVAETGEKLVDLYVNLNRPLDAEKCLRDLIEYLEKSLESEIKRRGLYAKLSSILRDLAKTNPRRLRDALDAVRIAVARDPVSAYERKELAQVHFELRDYAAAETAWEQALLFDPNNAGLHVRIGHVAMLRAMDSDDIDVRTDALARARHRLKAALDLYDPNSTERTSALYLRAFIHIYSGRRADALRDLLALDGNTEYPTEVRLQTADVYLAKEEWPEAEKRFRELAADLDARILKESDGVNTSVDSFLGDATVLGTASAFAHLGIASSLLGRSVGLPEALTEVSNARAKTDALTDAAIKRDWTARCDFFEGQILLSQDQVEPAIAKLEAALTAYLNQDLYLRLAEALTRRVELAGKGQEMPTVRRALWYCSEATRLDWTHQLAKRILPVVARLEALETTPPSHPKSPALFPNATIPIRKGRRLFRALAWRGESPPLQVRPREER